jgi:hypothetical protein
MDGITVLVPETNQDLTNCALHRTLILALPPPLPLADPDPDPEPDPNPNQDV